MQSRSIADILSILMRTIWWSALATVACLLIAYPVAFGICFAPAKWRPLLLLLIILPFWINLLIRTYALKSVLGARGVINTVLGWVGVGPLDMLGTTPAVIFGLFYVFLPFMVLPLYATIERLDKAYLEASLDLGASQAQTFFNVTLPLTMPGIITGIILVFIPCLGMFLISDELGGTTSWMIANVIQNQFGSANNWPFGAALSFLLMAATIIVLVIQHYWQKTQQGSGGIMAAQLKPGSGPLEFGKRKWLQGLFAATLLVLYLPIFVLIAYSFNIQNRGGVWRGFTWENYPKAWNNSAIYDAMINSLTIAFITTFFATIIGTLVAVLLWRFKFPFRAAYEGAMTLPIVIPEVCMGVALLMFYSATGMTSTFAKAIWPFNLWTIIIAHIAFCFPFVAIVVRSQAGWFQQAA